MRDKVKTVKQLKHFAILAALFANNLSSGSEKEKPSIANFS